MKTITYLRDNGIEMFWEHTSEFMFPAQENKIRSIKPTRTSFREGDTVFFSNHIDFPRFKFREWAHSRGVRIAKRPQNANVIIVDEDYLTGLLNRAEECLISKQRLSSEILNVSFYEKLFTDQTVYFHLQEPRLIGDRNVDVRLLKFNTYKKHTNALEQATILAQYDKAEFMDFPVFTKQVAENTLLTTDLFWDLYNMMKGSDSESKELAYEMLTNVNIELSKFKVDLLIYSNLDEISHSKVWNKVTFKPLRYYMNNKKHPPYWNSVNLEEETSCLRLIRRLKKSYEREDCIDKIDHSLVKELLSPFFEKRMEQIRDYIPELIPESTTFSLNAELYPKQIKKLLDVAKESNSRESMGESVQESIDSLLPEYSDEQE